MDTDFSWWMFHVHRETAYPFVLLTTVTVRVTSDQTSTNTAATLSPYMREFRRCDVRVALELSCMETALSLWVSLMKFFIMIVCMS